MDEHPAFELELRRALAHFYDPVFLNQSPLIQLLCLENEANPAGALRNAIEQGIRSLQPDPATPPTSPRQRAYHLLFYRYVQQLAQRDVANQLGLSSRQLRREQDRALQALAAHLRLHSVQPANAETRQDEEANLLSQGINREMSWLRHSLADGVTQVQPVLKEATRLAEPVARMHRVVLDLAPSDEAISASIAGTVLKQVILNVLTAAIHGVPDGCIAIASQVAQGHVVVSVRSQARAHGSRRPPEQDGLDMAARLLDMFRGTLRVSAADLLVQVDIVLPQAEQMTVLAIEDNADTLQLWERYLEGTRFHLVGVRDPDQAFRIVTELKPKLIILDVMMPGVDGWELLSQFRHHPLTSRIPIIVCTVLPQEEVAHALGAVAFIRKPATRQVFRDALAQQIEASEQER